MAWSIRSSQALTLALFFVSFLVQPAGAASLRAYVDNVQGIRSLQKKEFFMAYKDFLQALSHDPLNPDLQMNLALTLELNEEWEKAEKAYLSAYALSQGDSKRQFAALFGLGNARKGKSETDLALEAYQGALEIDPNSIEVKTNIELLTQSQSGEGKSKKGKGGGNGDSKDDKENDKDDKDKDKDNKNKKDENKDQQSKDQKPQQQQKKQPKPFESKDLNKEDVRKILDEIQAQEQSIRAKEQERGAKERTRDKDW
jgi:hypothetical protein